MNGSDCSGLGSFLVFDAFNVLRGPGSGENPRFLVYVREAILFHGRDGVRPHPDNQPGDRHARDRVPDPERCPCAE
jgi:hypothetical protein